MSGDPGVGSRVRPAREEDEPAILGLVRDAGLPGDGIAGSWRDFAVAVAADGTVVGAAGLEAYGRAGLLRSVVTRPGLRGAGVGGELVRACLAQARERGLREVYLLTQTAADYFPRFGFRPFPRDAAPEAVQRSPEFASICPADAVCLRLDVEPGGSGG